MPDVFVIEHFLSINLFLSTNSTFSEKMATSTVSEHKLSIQKWAPIRLRCIA